MTMKRRDFSWAVAGSALGTGVLCPAMAQSKKPQAGKDYQLVEPRAPVETPAPKVEVVEFFGYYCPHCNAFEPELAQWIKTLPNDVAFRRLPVAFRDALVPQQRLYFALDAMGLVEPFHTKVFAAIHTEKIKLDKGDEMAAWLGKQGVDAAKFLHHYNSHAVSTSVTRATQWANAYQIDGVPAFGVAGRFMVVGSSQGLQVVDALIADLRSER